MVWTCSSEFFGYVYNEIEKENTMNIQIFGTKKCNDTKKAEHFFKERGIKYQFIDMKEKGMSKGEFTSVAQANGGLENMINWDGIYNDENIKSIKYTIYNSTCGFTDMSDDPDNYRKKNNINMKSMGVSGVDDNAIKLMIVVELPTSEDAFNRYMQSIYEEKQAMIKAVNNAIIEADVTYNDGTEKVEYYKIKTGKYAITTMDIYKQVE